MYAKEPETKKRQRALLYAGFQPQTECRGLEGESGGTCGIAARLRGEASYGTSSTIYMYVCICYGQP